MQEQQKETLRRWMGECAQMVFFGGAGISTESGIPDFRGEDGLYFQKYKYPPETIISHSFYKKNPQEFYQFYRDRMIYPDAAPNRAHMALAKLEAQGKLKAVITQNIDGLHQAAGSKEVLELHGSVNRNYCMRCGRFFCLKEMLDSEDSEGIPRCSCGGIIKPDVVLYEEGLDQKVLSRAEAYIMQADMLIVGGTSLMVWPAAGLVDCYRGNRMVLINKTRMPMDARVDLAICGKLGEVLGDAVGMEPL